MLNKLWKLFIATFQLSAFTFGGGYVVLPLMKDKFVDDYKWLEEEEMLDLMTISQSAPGIIAINLSIALGYKLVGAMGILVAILGTALPPFIIITLISIMYDYFIDNQLIALLLEGMQAGVSAVIVSVALSMGFRVLQEKNWLFNTILILSFVLNFFFNIHVAPLIIGTIIIGLIAYWVESRQMT